MGCASSKVRSELGNGPDTIDVSTDLMSIPENSKEKPTAPHSKTKRKKRDKKLRAKSYRRVRKKSKLKPDSEPAAPDSKTKAKKPKKYIRVKKKKLKNKPDSKPAAPDLEPTAPDSEPTAPDSAPTAPGSEPPPRKQGFAAFQKSKQMRTAPDSAPTIPDSEPTVPDSESELKHRQHLIHMKDKAMHSPLGDSHEKHREHLIHMKANHSPLAASHEKHRQHMLHMQTEAADSPEKPTRDQPVPETPDSERNTPGSDENTTDLNRIDTKGWLAKDQELHKQQVRASLWSETS